MIVLKETCLHHWYQQVMLAVIEMCTIWVQCYVIHGEIYNGLSIFVVFFLEEIQEKTKKIGIYWFFQILFIYKMCKCIKSLKVLRGRLQIYLLHHFNRPTAVVFQLTAVLFIFLLSNSNIWFCIEQKVSLSIYWFQKHFNLLTMRWCVHEIDSYMSSICCRWLRVRFRSRTCLPSEKTETRLIPDLAKHRRRPKLA